MKTIVRVLALGLFSTVAIVYFFSSIAQGGDDASFASFSIFNPFTTNIYNIRAEDDLELPRSEKVVVIGKLSNEDTSWVDKDLPNWQNAVYVVNDTSAPLHTPMNKGREALPYLTYLIDNYDHLPQLIAFVHSHKDGFPKAWHTDAAHYSNVEALQTLRPSTVMHDGYVNLRCNPLPGCPDWMKPHEGRKEPIGEREMPTAFRELFGDAVELPATIAQACCAQFAVSRQQVLKRSRADYMRYRQWILDSKLSDEVVGRIWEYLWHIVFGQGPVFCPAYRMCTCLVYGRLCSRFSLPE